MLHGPTHDQSVPSAPGGPPSNTALKFCVHCRKPNHLKAHCHSLKNGEPANTTRPLPVSLEPLQPKEPVQMHSAVSGDLDDHQFYFELAAVVTDVGHSAGAGAPPPVHGSDGESPGAHVAPSNLGLRPVHMYQADPGNDESQFCPRL